MLFLFFFSFILYGCSSTHLVYRVVEKEKKHKNTSFLCIFFSFFFLFLHSVSTKVERYITACMMTWHMEELEVHKHDYSLFDFSVYILTVTVVFEILGIWIHVCDI